MKTAALGLIAGAILLCVAVAIGRNPNLLLRLRIGALDLNPRAETNLDRSSVDLDAQSADMGRNWSHLTELWQDIARRDILAALGVILALAVAALGVIDRSKAPSGRSRSNKGTQANSTQQQGTATPKWVTSTDFDEKQGTLWLPDVEYEMHSTSWSGNPFDVRASVTYKHVESNTLMTSELFFNGNDTWKMRFTGTRPGEWVFKTESDVSELDAKTGRITVSENGTYNGFLTNVGTKWGWSAIGSVFVPQLVMYTTPQHYYNKPERIDADIDTFLQDHGFNGFHIYSIGDGWTDLERGGQGRGSGKDPDPRTFEALEQLIGRTYDAGGMVHIWAWGDRSRGMTPPGGKNSQADKRLQRYIAARLGPVPGWSMGYGFDLNEWVKEPDIVEWRQYMHDHFGWDHLLGGRPRGPNSGTDHSEYDSWNEALDYASYEHHRPTYEVYAAAIESSPEQPVMSEDRFRIDAGRPEVDYSPERTRRGLYDSTMAGGVGNIWGNLTGENQGANSGEVSSGEYPNIKVLDTYSTFFFDKDRFTPGMRRVNGITDGVALRTPNGQYVVYKQSADSVRVNLSATSGPNKAVAVDTATTYQERRIGPLEATDHTWDAPYTSDWILAIGSF